MRRFNRIGRRSSVLAPAGGTKPSTSAASVLAGHIAVRLSQPYYKDLALARLGRSRERRFDTPLGPDPHMVQ